MSTIVPTGFVRGPVSEVTHVCDLTRKKNVTEIPRPAQRITFFNLRDLIGRFSIKPRVEKILVVDGHRVRGIRARIRYAVFLYRIRGIRGIRGLESIHVTAP